MVILDRRLWNGKDFYTKMILAFHVYFPLNLILNFFFLLFITEDTFGNLVSRYLTDRS